MLLRRSRRGFSAQTNLLRSVSSYLSEPQTSIPSSSRHSASPPENSSATAPTSSVRRFPESPFGSCTDLALQNETFTARGYDSLKSSRVGLCSSANERRDFGGFPRLLSTQAAVEASTSDGLTVEGILSNQWLILDENEGDWKSHAAAIAQSIHLIKKRLQMLSVQLEKPNIWDDPVHAGRISKEQGSLMSRMKEVLAFERELLGHIDMIKLAREEDDSELESDSLNSLLRMRRISKEKELEALLYLGSRILALAT